MVKIQVISINQVMGGDEMSDRGTSNSPNTRNPERPPSNPARLDQFADDIFDGNDEDKEKLDVTSRRDKEKLFKKEYPFG